MSEYFFSSKWICFSRRHNRNFIKNAVSREPNRAVRVFLSWILEPRTESDKPFQIWRVHHFQVFHPLDGRRRFTPSTCSRKCESVCVPVQRRDRGHVYLTWKSHIIPFVGCGVTWFQYDHRQGLTIDRWNRNHSINWFLTQTLFLDFIFYFVSLVINRCFYV